MSGINWTDEQVTGYLQRLDARLAESIGAIVLDFEFIVWPRGDKEWEYRLYPGREMICLTRTQAHVVEDWIQSHKHPQQTSEEQKERI